MPAILRNFIDGAWVPSDSVDGIDIINPATEEAVGIVPAGSPADVDAAVRSAGRAFPGWAALPLRDRLGMLEDVAAAIEAHAGELAELECDEMGKPVAMGRSFIEGGVAGLRDDIELARTYEFVRTAAADDQTLVVRHPLGVAGVIVPWNFTVVAALLALGPLLASGNTVVLKPSEKASLSAVRLLEILDLPAGVLNMVLGDGRAGAALSEHPDVALIHFTGSVESGRAVGAANGARLRRSVLELGGKDPVIVDADVDPAATARDVAVGAFINTGQICTSMERIYVHRDIAPAFIDALVAEAETYACGNGRDPKARLGPLVDERQRNVVIAHVEDAVAAGATVLAGGKTPEGPGFFYPATVLTGVTDGMLIMREETFGPVAPVQVVDTFDQAMAKAADSRYGLAATIYSNDPGHIAAAYRLPAAIIWINQWQAAGAPGAYEPAGQSGAGATGGRASFDAATRPAKIVRGGAAAQPPENTEKKGA